MTSMLRWIIRTLAPVTIALGMIGGSAAQAQITQSDFAPIYSAEDFARCAGAQPQAGSIGISSDPVEARRNAIAACLVRQWSGGMRWAGAGLEVTGERIAGREAFRAGAPIILSISETYRRAGDVIGWDSRGYVTATSGGGEEERRAVASDRFTTLITRLGEEEPLQQGRGLSGFSLPEGVYGIEVRLDRPATPSGPAGIDILRSVVAVANPARDRSAAWLQMRISSSAYPGNGATLEPRRYVVGSERREDRTACEAPIVLASDALRGEGVVETDLSLVSERAEWRPYAATWRIVDAAGAVVSSLTRSQSFQIDPTRLADGRYKVEAALQPGDRAADTGLRFRIGPSEFILNVRCAAPVQEYAAGSRVLAQLEIRRNTAPPGQPARYATIQTNAERIQPVQLRNGENRCEPARFDAYGRYGTISNTGTVSYDVLIRPQSVFDVRWMLMDGDATVGDGRGSSFSFDPSTLRDGNYTLTLEATPGAGPARTLKYLDIRGCGGGEREMATGAPPGGATIRVCKGEEGGVNTNTQRVEIVACDHLIVRPDDPPEQVVLAPFEFDQWFDKADRNVADKIAEKIVAPDPLPGNEPLVDDFDDGGWTDAHCAQAGREIRHREGVLRLSCAVPEGTMRAIFSLHQKYLRERASLTRLGGGLEKDAEFLIEGFPQKIRKLAGDYGKLQSDAEAQGLIYRVCPTPVPELLPGVPVNKLIWKTEGLEALKNAKTRFANIEADWRALFDQKARTAYDARVARLVSHFGLRRATLQSIAGDADDLRKQLYGHWIGGQYPHCLGDIRNMTVGDGIPDLPGMRLTFTPAPELKPFPKFDLLAAQYRPRVPEWKLDASEIARQRRQAEHELAIRNLDELSKLFTTTEIAKATGNKLWESVSGAWNFIWHTPLHEIGELDSKASAALLDYLTAPDAKRARRTKNGFARAYDYFGPKITDTLSNYARAMSETSHRAFLAKFDEATALPWNEAYVNLRAYNTLRDANRIAASAKAEIGALSTMNQFMLETALIPAAAQTAGGAAVRGLSAAARAQRLARMKELIRAKRALAQRRLDRLKESMTPERAATTQQAFDQAFDPNDLAGSLEKMSGAFSEAEIAAISRQAKRLEAATDKGRVAQARTKVREALERKARNEALRGDAESQQTVNKLDEIEDRIDDLDRRNADLEGEVDRYNRKVDALEDSGVIDADQADAIDDALPDRGVDPEAERAADQALEDMFGPDDGGGGARDILDPDDGVPPPNPDIDAPPVRRPTTLRGVLENHDPATDPPITLSVNRNGNFEPVTIEGYNTSGQTADILFVGKGDTAKAWKVPKDPTKFEGEIDGYDVAESSGIEVIEIENRASIDRRQGAALIDPASGETKGVIVRRRLADNEIGENAKLDANGRLDVEHQRAMLDMLRELTEKKVFWGDFKLANVAFVRKPPPNGPLRAAVLDSNYIKRYDDIARAQFDGRDGRKLFDDLTPDEREAFYTQLRQDQTAQAFSHQGFVAQRAGHGRSGGGAQGALYEVIDPALTAREAPEVFKLIDDELVKNPSGLHPGFAKAWGLNEAPLPNNPQQLLQGANALSDEARDVRKQLDDAEAERDRFLGVDEAIGPDGTPSGPVAGPVVAGAGDHAGLTLDLDDGWGDFFDIDPDDLDNRVCQ